MTTLQTLFKIADETEAITHKLLELIAEFPTGGKQIHDANIVATMLIYDNPRPAMCVPGKTYRVTLERSLCA